MPRKFHVTTFGCQMNVHDSERMRGMLASLGYEEAAAREEADVILFNTCSIRESADSRFIAHLGEAKRLKGEDPGRVVGVGGCWAQSVKDEVFQRFPFVDVAFGPGQIHRLAEFLNSDSLSAQGYFEFEDFSGHLPARREREFQAWLQISQGCNCRCSYCIVPSTRGREVSRDPGELVAEAEGLAADGVLEVTLLGQNVNSYGRDLPGERRASFAELLGRIDAVEGIERIRYTSPHPKDMREDVIRAHAELPALCEHIHLPLQSGSSPVLKRMRRTYDRGRYMDRVALIREHVPDCALTTDIIVGFPGETEADFAATLAVVEEVGYDGAFTFVFSPRRETEAATMGDQVPHPVKVERMERLVEAVQRRAHERAQRFVGRTMEVLVEGASRTDPTRLRGRTRHNKAVNFDGEAAAGELVEVEIESATSQTLSGVAVKPLSRLLDDRRAAVIAIFGPTGVGKTGVAVALAELLRERGEDPVAINCDALQVYEGMPILTGTASAAEQALLEHRLLGFVPVTADFSVGDYMPLAHAEIDAALAAGRRPIVVGGTGLYLRAALADLSLVKAPPGAEDSELWSPNTRHPTSIFGLNMDRALLYERIDSRVEAMVGAGAAAEARRAEALGPGRTARKALGFDELLAGDVESMKRRSRNYARRQLTWMRKIPDLHRVDRTGLSDREAAEAIVCRA